ncbi:zinc metalloprotease [Amylibacter ulvae]|uniref:Zinc metalloprotease n=1 Tax=Paramylibacter ulvae TaxID=1651968 RepID=A0ABQ3CYI3_9RHOB|nr:RIP metalloprotease RseP [Amylibacter ulvae]GHA42337.1 zinc metalloprotease [Amylibacter ulvae]
MFEMIESIPVFGNGLLVVVAMVIVLGTVVSIHEYGHYIVGRWCGIDADVFSIGFGKVIYSRYDKRGTKWQVAAIPLGGYVKFRGDLDAASTQGKENLANLPPEEAARSFPTAPLYKRALTVMAGPVFNFILSIVIFTGLGLYSGQAVDDMTLGKVIAPKGTQYEIREGDKILAVDGVEMNSFLEMAEWAATAEANKNTIYTVERGNDRIDVTGPFPAPAYAAAIMPVSAASSADMRAGDFIVSLDNKEVNSFRQLVEVVKTVGVGEIPITVLRDGEKLTFPIRPREQVYENADGEIETRILLGISGGNAFEPAIIPVGFGTAVSNGVSRTWAVISGSVRGIKLMFQGAISPKNLQGPVGIAHMSSDVAKSGWISLIALIGIISTAIGFLNLMPLPVLDGGHLVQFAYQGVVGKPMNERVVRYATVVSLSLLLTLMLYSTSNDLVRWFQ